MRACVWLSESKGVKEKTERCGSEGGAQFRLGCGPVQANVGSIKRSPSSLGATHSSVSTLRARLLAASPASTDQKHGQAEGVLRETVSLLPDS